MNGPMWRIALCTAMLDHGEDAVTDEQVAVIANTLFPNAVYAADALTAGFELRQFRKHLVFIRDPCVANPPSLRDMIWHATSWWAMFQKDTRSIRAVMKGEGYGRKQ